MQKQQDLGHSQTGALRAGVRSGRRNFGSRAGLAATVTLSAAIFGAMAFGGNVRADSLSADQLQLAQSGTALSIDEIRDCLCMEQRMTSMRADVELRQDMLNERQQELANIDQQVKSQQAALQPDDTVGQQVLKDLLTQQQGLRNLLQNDLRPAYNGEASQLNEVVAKYNSQCVNRARYTADLKAAQQDLQCPKP